jgi:PAS domain S-box-containing protein
MTTGSGKEDGLKKNLVEQGGGQSIGVPADGEVEGNSVSPMGGPGFSHWQASYIDKDGLNERGNIFFAAVEMTRMPMLVTDPRQPDDPIVFANGAFLDLTGYRQKDILGRNCRLLQGPDTDRGTIDEVRRAIREQRAVAVDVLNYKADGTPFWNALFLGPIFDQHGQLLYFFASQMDITERRQTRPGGMTGLELVERVRASRPQLPVLVTTGYMDELPGRERGQGLSVLAKPYKHEELLARVKAVLA